MNAAFSEQQRLAALLALDVLDTEPEPAFDEVAKLAGQLCETPIALVTLVDAERQWFKARVGLDVVQTPREVAFCAHAIEAQPLFIVRDAANDSRFAQNPLVVGEPQIRFYAGVPLVLSDGAAVGTLCVIDRVPRELTEGQIQCLSMLARQVASELDLRRRLRTLQRPDRAAVLEGGVVAQRYRIGTILGHGGMGIVVAAHDLVADRSVAIKFLLPGKLASDETRERFVREARALLKIESDHVARVLDVGNLASGAPFIVMEHLEGEDLEARLEREHRIAPAEAVAILEQACDGVAAAHAVGVLHRDLKPANLFLVPDARGNTRVKVVDFGLALLAESRATQLTNSAMVLGTPAYMSPEQFDDSSEVDARSDVWALGVVLFELLTGELPFPGESATAIYAKVLTGDAPIVHELCSDVPRELSAVVAKCLVRDRNKRFASVHELRRALHQATTQRGVFAWMTSAFSRPRPTR